MGKDYYSILGVARTANEHTIREAYRQRALKYHPDKTQSAAAARRFREVAEAYEVLSDKKKRDIFDTGGEEALKGGCGNGQGGMPNASVYRYEYHGEPLATFAQFFGCTSPFDSKFMESIFGSLGTDLFMEGRPGGLGARLEPPIEKDVFVSLEEVFTGCVKRMMFSRKVEARTGELWREEAIFEINVRPGWKAGTKVTFQRQGHRRIGRIPADVVYVIRDQPHQYFHRDGEHIVYSTTVSLKQALCGFQMNIPPLQEANAPLKLVVHQVLHPGSIRRFRGAGLPYSKDPTLRGDLIVRLDIRFPISLTPEQVASLEKLL